MIESLSVLMLIVGIAFFVFLYRLNLSSQREAADRAKLTDSPHVD